MFSVFQAQCIKQIIQFFGAAAQVEPYTRDKTYVVGLAIGLSVSAAVRSLVTHWEFERVTVSGMRIRVALCSALYKKVRVKIEQTTTIRMYS